MSLADLPPHILNLINNYNHPQLTLYVWKCADYQEEYISVIASSQNEAITILEKASRGDYKTPALPTLPYSLPSLLKQPEYPNNFDTYMNKNGVPAVGYSGFNLMNWIKIIQETNPYFVQPIMPGVAFQLHASSYL
jgi:hypothetical protein